MQSPQRFFDIIENIFKAREDVKLNDKLVVDFDFLILFNFNLLTNLTINDKT